MSLYSVFRNFYEFLKKINYAELNGEQEKEDKMVASYDHSNYDSPPISSKFHICITFIKLSAKYEYGFCLINDNQDQAV